MAVTGTPCTGGSTASTTSPGRTRHTSWRPTSGTTGRCAPTSRAARATCSSSTTAGEGRERLAPFLGIEEPPFPISTQNPAGERNEARRALDKIRDLLAALLGGKTRYGAALSLYYDSFDALAGLADASGSPAADRVLAELLRATDGDLKDLRSTLDLPTLAQGPMDQAPSAAWRRQDTIIRNTIGAVTYANVRRRSARSGRQVEEMGRGLLEAATAAGDEIRRLRTAAAPGPRKGLLE